MYCPNSKVTQKYFGTDPSETKEIKYDSAIQHVSNCFKCNSHTVHPINLVHDSHFKVKCPICEKVTWYNTFEFALRYLLEHVPNSPLLDEYYSSINAENAASTFPIIRFVKNYVEFQKTLIGN